MSMTKTNDAVEDELWKATGGRSPRRNGFGHAGGRAASGLRFGRTGGVCPYQHLIVGNQMLTT